MTVVGQNLHGIHSPKMIASVNFRRLDDTIITSSPVETVITEINI